MSGAGFTVNYEEPYPEWNEMVFYRWGYARVKAVDAQTLEWEWLSGFDGERYDKMKITQNVTASWVLPEEEEDPSPSGEQEDDDDELSTGALVGIYVACAAAISVVSVGVYVLVTRQLRREGGSEDSKASADLISPLH